MTRIRTKKDMCTDKPKIMNVVPVGHLEELENETERKPRKPYW